MERTITIARRFRGPPDSANGGYACGVLGRHVHGAARIRLHRPPPLDTPIVLDTDPPTLRVDSTLIAEGAPAELSAEVPAPVSFDAAAVAARGYRWFNGHPYPTCFVCGPERDAGDGLRIFPGLVPTRDVVAAPWVPDETVCDAEGLVEPEITWAVLDCPSGIALLEIDPLSKGALLGQLIARVVRRPALGERCVAMGWWRGRDGRKLYSGAVLYTETGELLGSSEAIWIELKAT